MFNHQALNLHICKLLKEHLHRLVKQVMLKTLVCEIL